MPDESDARIAELEAQLADLRKERARSDEGQPSALTVVTVVLVILLIIAGALWFAFRDKIDFGSTGGIEPGIYQGVSGDWCADAGGVFIGGGPNLGTPEEGDTAGTYCAVDGSDEQGT